MAKATGYYWDSCAWLGLINGEPGKCRELEIIYNSSKSGNFELWTSALSITEVRRINVEVNAPKPLDQAHLKTINDLFRQPFVKVIPLSQEIAEHARELWRTTDKLGKWQDSIHVASSLRWNIETMHTYDAKDLLHLSNKLKCRNGNLLNICYPKETTDGPLFGQLKK